jgi:myo-inositol 2-dehydrogenase/D-chiro-inositol 1-dehydrogenase
MGQIGDPHLIHVTSRDPAPPPLEYIRRSGGIFLDMTIHDFDMMRYLSGQEAVEIYAAAGVMVDKAIGRAGDLDTAIVTLKMDRGTLGTIDNSRKAVYGYDQRVEVFGSAGSIRTDNHYPNAAVLSTSAGILRDRPLHFFIERYAESFVEEMLAFVRAVLDDEPVQVTGRDGRIPLVMALAAARSVSENRPIRLTEMETPSVLSGSYR